jgi:hypothetical protein
MIMSRRDKQSKWKAYLLYWNEQTTEFFLPNTVLLIIYLCIGIIGNLSVILVYQFRLKKKQDGRYFIAPLAWMDFIALIVTASLNLTRNTRQVTYPQHGACKMLIYHNSCYCSYLLTPFSCVSITRFRLPQCYICDTDNIVIGTSNDKYTHVQKVNIPKIEIKQ